MNVIRRIFPVKNNVMLHTPLEVLAQQNRLRPRTQNQSRNDFPGLRQSSKREPLKAVRSDFVNEVFNPWPEEDENRPETPFVKTRLQRQMLSSGGSRPNVPVDTADVFTNHGMYKRRMTTSPKIQDTSFSRLANIPHGSSRCATPIPIEQPLTKLCWDNKIDEDDSDTESSLTDVLIRRAPPSIRTPRLRIASPFRFQRHVVNDVTVSDLDSVDQTDREHSNLSEPLNLTQKVLQTYFQKKLNNTQRIVRWLADCEEKTRGSTLPSHLPDIMYTCHSRGQMSPINNNLMNNTV